MKEMIPTEQARLRYEMALAAYKAAEQVQRNAQKDDKQLSRRERLQAFRLPPEATRLLMSRLAGEVNDAVKALVIAEYGEPYLPLNATPEWWGTIPVGCGLYPQLT